MKSHRAEVTIEASAEAIWAILIDGASYPDWDSGVISVEGTIAAGEKITVTSEANPKRGFAVTVSEFTPNERMVWTGGMPLGLFQGVRSYDLSSAGEGKTTFSMREEYSGPLQPLMSRMMPDLQPSFDQFANGLKAKAESSG